MTDVGVGTGVEIFSLTWSNLGGDMMVSLKGIMGAETLTSIRANLNFFKINSSSNVTHNFFSNFLNFLIMHLI